MSLGFLWCEGSKKDKAQAVIDILMMNKSECESDISNDMDKSEEEIFISKDSQKLQELFWAILQMAIMHSVLYKTDTDPDSSFYRQILQDIETFNVIMSLYRNEG